jgi:hypothetical protein
METSGPSFAREAVGPLRRLWLGPSRVLRPPRWRFLWYGVPLGILALIGLGAANVQYLRDNRPGGGRRIRDSGRASCPRTGWPATTGIWSRAA